MIRVGDFQLLNQAGGHVDARAGLSALLLLVGIEHPGRGLEGASGAGRGELNCVGEVRVSGSGGHVCEHAERERATGGHQLTRDRCARAARSDTTHRERTGGTPLGVERTAEWAIHPRLLSRALI